MLYRTLLFLFVLCVCPAFAAIQDGSLRVEVLAGHNLVIDNNESPRTYAPETAFVGVKFHNSGSQPLTDIVAKIGDYKGGVGDTPGVYPSRTHVGLTGTFSLTHQGGSLGLADATRYIASIPAGGSVTVYWLVGYPHTDTNGVPTSGFSTKPDDDLWMEYDVWATAKEGVTSRAVDVTQTVYCRQDIAASANKIFPNGANKVPQYYLDLMQQYVPAWTNKVYDGSVGTRVTTECYWYDLGVVTGGYDIDGDLVPDMNAWMQPVGDPALFDAGAFRLVRTYAMVVVKLKIGGEKVYIVEDQLYFTQMPENNGVVGYVMYEFVPLLPNARAVTTPYQVAASGNLNEKYNADYGVSLGDPIISKEAKVSITKTASVATVSLNGTINYTMNYTNSGTLAIGDPAAGLPLVMQERIPSGTSYVAGTATNNNVLPSGVSGYKVLYSTDNGTNWVFTQPTPASAVTHIQWWLNDALPVGASGTFRLSVTVNTNYAYASPFIVNQSGLSLGNTVPFATAQASSLLLGTNSVGGTVYADTGVGTGAYFGNGIKEGAEPGISNILVRLYADLNGNGVVDAGEPIVASTNTSATGTYLFNNVQDGRFVAVSDSRDTDMPTGYTPSLTDYYAINLDSAHTNAAPVNVLAVNIGYAPAVVALKSRVGTGVMREGQLLTYTLAVTNRLAGSGTAAANGATYMMWPTNVTSGSNNKGFTNPQNVCNANEPDLLYATAPYKDTSETMLVNGYNYGAQLGTPTNVTIQIPMKVIGGTFPTNNTLQVIVNMNGTQIGTQTIDCGSFGSSTYLLSLDVTSYRPSWSWTNFNGTALSVELISKKGGNPTQTLDIDSVGFKIVTDQLVGGTSATTTLDPAPLDDRYDARRLSFVSATVAPNAVTTNNNEATLHWNNIGPIYAGGGREVNVTFEVLQPPNNIAALLTNTVSVTQAKFLSGILANSDERWVTNNVLPGGLISGYVWRDLNAPNGPGPGAGEPGVGGVTVRLLPPAGVDLGAGTNQPITTVTDTNGWYRFTSLPGSTNYTVTIITNTLPGGAGTPTYDYDGTNTAHNAVIPIIFNATNGQDTVTTANFGYTLQSTVRGTIWTDLNKSGTSSPDSGEDPLAGVTVSLYNSSGVLQATTNTAANGTYTFVGTYSGSYTVRVDRTVGPFTNGTWTATYDSDGITGGSTNQVLFSISAGALVFANFSYYKSGAFTIGDTLFYDWNGDTLQTDGVDTGIPNISVWLYQDENTNGVVDASDAFIAESVSNANGNYGFSNLVAGTYLLIVDQSDTNFPALAIPTAYPPGAVNGRSVVTLTAGDSLGQDFGYKPYGSASIGGVAWYDANADGAQFGALERGLSNITVRLLADLDGNGTYNEVSSLSTTNNGSYVFSSIPAGPYRVIVDTGDADIPKDSFAFRYQPTTTTNYTISVTNQQSVLSANFGFAPLGAVGDTIFWDNNGSGEQDMTEPGISNVTVKIYSDINLNGLYDVGETNVATTLTDVNGQYTFAGLPQGRYVVLVDLSASPILTGATLTADPDTNLNSQTSISITPGTSFMGADFGYKPSGGMLGGQLWIDMNNNHKVDAGEQGIPYINVFIYAGLTLISSNETDFSGYYIFNGLTNGTYNVLVSTNDVDFPKGLTASYDADGVANNVTTNIVISGGHIISINGNTVSNVDLSINFAYRYTGTNTVSGTVGVDATPYDGLLNGTNPSGVATNEAPFTGTSVFLYYWADNGNKTQDVGEVTLVSSAITDSNGDYSFAELPNGDANARYIVSLSAPSSNIRLTTTTNSTGAVMINTTTNMVGDTLTVNQVFTIQAVRQNTDFAFESMLTADFGDLPRSYGTLITDSPNGPYHTTNSIALRLGTQISFENNGKPSVAANTDAYDDGVKNLGNWTETVNGGKLQVTVSGTNGWLVGWIDFNHDGTFTNFNEMVFNQAVSVGTTNLTFTIPVGTYYASTQTLLYARFRLYTSQPVIPMFAGAAAGGEVEDYRFEQLVDVTYHFQNGQTNEVNTGLICFVDYYRNPFPTNRPFGMVFARWASEPVLRAGEKISTTNLVRPDVLDVYAQWSPFTLKEPVDVLVTWLESKYPWLVIPSTNNTPTVEEQGLKTGDNGYPIWQSYALGLDPTNFMSVLLATIPNNELTNKVTIGTWSTVPTNLTEKVLYFAEGCKDSGAGQPINNWYQLNGVGTKNPDSIATYPMLDATSNRFFRVRVNIETNLPPDWL